MICDKQNNCHLGNCLCEKLKIAGLKHQRKRNGVYLRLNITDEQFMKDQRNNFNKKAKKYHTLILKLHKIRLQTK